jgi:hypothetical protein
MIVADFLGGNSCWRCRISSCWRLCWDRLQLDPSLYLSRDVPLMMMHPIFDRTMATLRGNEKTSYGREVNCAAYGALTYWCVDSNPHMQFFGDAAHL